MGEGIPHLFLIGEKHLRGVITRGVVAGGVITRGAVAGAPSTPGCWGDTG